MEFRRFDDNDWSYFMSATPFPLHGRVADQKSREPIAAECWVNGRSVTRIPRNSDGRDPMSKTTMTYGDLPTIDELATGLGEDGWYHRMAGEDARVAEDIQMPARIPSTEAISATELYEYLAAMVARWEDGDDRAGDLASGILGVCGVEWI